MGGRAARGAAAVSRLAPAMLLALALQAGPAAASDPIRGAELYGRHCVQCHGSNGRGVLAGAPDFTNPVALLKPDLALLASVRNGKGAMPAYAGMLRDREILDIVSHLRTLR